VPDPREPMSTYRNSVLWRLVWISELWLDSLVGKEAQYYVDVELAAIAKLIAFELKAGLDLYHCGISADGSSASDLWHRRSSL
jgi:hypothetical protein